MLRQNINCFACFLFFIVWIPDCIAQTIDTSFTLLWYKGKKLNDTSLITVSGRTVRYSPSTAGLDVSIPEKKDVFTPLRQELNQSQQRKVEIDKLIMKTPRGSLNLGFIVQVNQAIDQACGTLAKLTETSLELVEKDGPLHEEISKMEVAPGGSIPAHLQQYYEEVMEFIIRIRRDGVPEPPVPPSVGFDYCYPCDKERQAAFKRDSIAFLKYLEEEREKLMKAWAVIHYFDFRKSKKLPYDSIRGWEMHLKMKEAMTTIITHVENKLIKAWNLYKNDATKVPFLSDQLLLQHRLEQLTGFIPGSNFPNLDVIVKHSTTIAINYLSRAKAEMNYKVLLNWNWIGALFRTAALLGLDMDQFEHHVMDFVGMNRFRVSIDANAKVSKGGNVYHARINGENYFGAVPDSDCVLKWILFAPDSSKMLYNLEEAQMQTHNVKATYAGTRRWKSTPADLKLDFCKTDRDTMMSYGFNPAEGNEIWVVPGGSQPLPIISNTFLHCFVDVKRMKALAADPSTQARMMQQMTEKYKEFMANNTGNKDPSKMSPDDMKKMNEAMNASRDISNIIHALSPASFLVKGQLRNNSKVVFDERLNGKELFPENTAIQEAIFRVKIEHAGE